MEWILGGNTTLQFQSGTVELFTRTGVPPQNDEGAEGITMREACSATSGPNASPLPEDQQVSCAGGWDPGNIGGNDQIVSFSPGAAASVDIHGALFAPDHNVELYSDNAGQPTIFGAIDCWSLELAVQDYSSPAVTSKAAGSLDIRTVILTATASGAGGGTAPVKEEAYVKIDSPGIDSVLSISTWRVCTPAGNPGSC